ncbi:MAG TPA: hypothetical protein H9870_00440 [Candidatus Corynebacterium avicola]|uniref:Secreted protein n=1 Tax=Candidatus Corynebacterium avicola TaxID=2838527 RepID=A0A9D1RM58_9CORY|nr:hypothetical protein [Candidatus Corynebacterium avicola]
MTSLTAGRNRYATLLLSAAAAFTLSTTAIPAAAAEPAEDRTNAGASESDPNCTPSDNVRFLDAFDQIVETLKDEVPAEARDGFNANADAMRGAILNTDVAYVDVSRQASDINETAEDNGDPYANYAVSRLDKIRNGDADASVAVQDLTLGEVTETIVLGLYTFTVPLSVSAAAMPAIGPIPGLENVATLPLIGSYATIGGLAKLPLQYGAQGIKALGKAMQSSVASNCWEGEEAASDEERLNQGGANPAVPVNPAERANADYLSLEGEPGETCTAGSEETINDAIDRAADGVRPQVPSGQEGAFDAEVARLQANASNARITNNFIPREAEDIHSLVAMVDNPLFTFAAGAVTGPMDESTAVGELNVGNSVDYAEIVEYLTSLIIGKVWGSLVPSTPNPVNGASYTSVPNFPNVASFLTSTGLDVYDNVIDTMCLEGTGTDGDDEGAADAEAEADSAAEGESDGE